METLINRWRGWSNASQEAELEAVKTFLDVYASDAPVWTRKVRGLSWSMMHRLSAFGQFLRVNHTSRKKLWGHSAGPIASGEGLVGKVRFPISPGLLLVA